MGLIESLPARPLSAAEVSKLNDADAVDLVAPVTEDGDAVRGVLVATAAWVQALAFTGDRWESVARVTLDETDRYDALRACEAEARDVLGRAVSEDEGS